ncbi:MAG: histidine kinase, partial [Bacteroidota bacterium]
QSDRGIIEFPLDRISLTAPPLRPYVKDYSINKIPTKTSLLLRQNQHLWLKTRQNTLDFQVSTIGTDYAAGATVAAHIVGQSILPRHYSPGEYVTNTNLSPGTHSLQLTAYNGRGERGETRILTIIIRPPLLQRPWFLLLLGCSLVGITYFIFYFRTQRQLKLAAEILQRQQAITAERDRIAAELHDDLGGDLASISFILDGHKSLTKMGVKAELDLNRLEQLANGAMKNMREMIWVLDDEQATLPTLAEQLLQNAREMAAAADLSLQAEIPDTLPELPLSSIQKKSILLIAKESMQNIRKHARASAFTLRLDIESGKNLLLVISDNGRGLKATEKGITNQPINHGHGLKNLQKRADEINATLSLSPALPRGAKMTLLVPLETPHK